MSIISIYNTEYLDTENVVVFIREVRLFGLCIWSSLTATTNINYLNNFDPIRFKEVNSEPESNLYRNQDIGFKRKSNTDNEEN